MTWCAALPSLATVLELDHVFSFVTDPHQAARRLEDDGWELDSGQAHRGQGTRNRRLAWRACARNEFWLYDALGPRIWIHRDNDISAFPCI